MALPYLNHTQISNFFIDKMMKEISGNETKIFLVIARKTIGWHKETDEISQSQIIDLSGISEGTVKSCLKNLADRSIIKIVKKGGAHRGDTTIYEINYDIQQDMNEVKGSNFNPLTNTKGSNSDPIQPNKGSNSDPTKEIEYKQSNTNKSDVVEMKFSDDPIDLIYKAYPARCPTSGRPTGKSLKDKSKILTVMKRLGISAAEMLSIQDLYIKEATEKKSYIKNFSTFLNNFPDKSQFINDDTTKSRPTFEEYKKLKRGEKK